MKESGVAWSCEDERFLCAQDVVVHTGEGRCKYSGRLPDRPGRADPPCGLVANFYSLKTKKIPAGRMALGDWSGCYKVVTW